MVEPPGLERSFERVWSVGIEEVGARVDKFLSAAGRLNSRAKALSALERGKIFLNALELSGADAGRRVACGDRLGLWASRPGSAKRRAPAARGLDDLHIAFEDPDLIVVAKLPGVLVMPLPDRTDTPTLVDEVQRHLRPHGKRRPLIVHRIDRDTSGLVIFAKSLAAQDALKRQFLEQEPERVYWAVVYGRLRPPTGSWRDLLRWDAERLTQTRAHPRDPQAKEAVSRYRVLEEFASASLIEVRLVTGKRNQIRIQARLHGHPLVGERQYAPLVETPVIQFQRQALHARALRFRHPRTGRPVAVEAPVPDDLAALLALLRTTKR